MYLVVPTCSEEPRWYRIQWTKCHKTEPSETVLKSGNISVEVSSTDDKCCSFPSLMSIGADVQALRKGQSLLLTAESPTATSRIPGPHRCPIKTRLYCSLFTDKCWVEVWPPRVLGFSKQWKLTRGPMGAPGKASLGLMLKHRGDSTEERVHQAGSQNKG